MRDKIKLVSSAGTRSLLHDHQEQAPAPGQDGTMKFDPVVRKHVAYKESKIK